MGGQYGGILSSRLAVLPDRRVNTEAKNRIFCTAWPKECNDICIIWPSALASWWAWQYLGVETVAMLNHIGEAGYRGYRGYRGSKALSCCVHLQLYQLALAEKEQLATASAGFANYDSTQSISNPHSSCMKCWTNTVKYSSATQNVSYQIAAFWVICSVFS